MPRNTPLSMLFASLLLVGLAGSASAVALVDYVGFGYESAPGGMKAIGDELTVLTLASAIDPVFGADFPNVEVTLVISGLMSLGTNDIGGTLVTSYSGGTLEMYDDAGNDADWGILPPNGTAPSTFINGNLLFSGAFTDFTLFLSGGLGAFEGHLDATGGSSIGTVCSNCAYSFAGVFTSAIGAQVPDGYDFQVDGTLEVDSSIAVDTQDSWGSIKSLYQN